MRRVSLLLVAASLCGLVAAEPAFALPHLSKSQTRLVSTLVARYVNDLVLRKDLADGWKISGPDMRGDLTRKQWMSGRQLPVQQLDVQNDPRTAWYAKWRTRTEIGLVISLRTGHGKNTVMYQEESMLQKLHGRWVVDSLYVDGIFRLGPGHSGSCVGSKCKVTGIVDYGASGGAANFAPGEAKIPAHWAFGVVFTVAGLVAAGLVGFGLYVRRRDRRARAAYLASRSP